MLKLTRNPVSDGPHFQVAFPLRTEDIDPESTALQGCGGCVALLLLVDALRRLGFRADAIGFDDFEKQAGGRSSDRKSNERIVVYPETIHGNPLKAKVRVRWLLYYPTPDVLMRWREKGDYIYSYWPQFVTDGLPAFPLTLMDLQPEQFKSNNHTGSGIAYRVGKGREYHLKFDYHLPQNLKGALVAAGVRKSDPAYGIVSDIRNAPINRLPDSMRLEKMANEFRSVRMYVSYDCESATAVIAALCGCITVIAPKPEMKPADILPCFRYGIAVGVENLAWAKETAILLRPYLESMQREGEVQIKAMVQAAITGMRRL